MEVRDLAQEALEQGEPLEHARTSAADGMQHAVDVQPKSLHAVTTLLLRPMKSQEAGNKRGCR
jgi:hypothetical protein